MKGEDKMTKLTELVKEYKKTKEEKIFTQIYKIIEKTIKEKVDYVFYEHTFKIGNKEFKLVNTKKIERDDISQELLLDFLEWINNFDSSVSEFDNYFYSCLWNWKPKNINAEFLQSLNTSSIYRINKEGEEENIADKMIAPEESNIEFVSNLTAQEEDVWKLIQGSLNLTQAEIAEELNISQKTVSNLISRINKKRQK